MAVTFRKNASRETLYALAVENGVEVAEDAERAEIIAALEAYNAAEDGDDNAAGNDTPEEKPAESSSTASSVPASSSAASASLKIFTLPSYSSSTATESGFLPAAPGTRGSAPAIS